MSQWPQEFQTSMDDCNHDRCTYLSETADQCHLRGLHPGEHDLQGKSHLESQHPVSQQIPDLLELAHVIICNGRAWQDRDEEIWEGAKRKWIDGYHAYLKETVTGV